MSEALQSTIRSFRRGVDLQSIIDKLSMASVDYSRYSTTVSYFPDADDSRRMRGYELHAFYTGRLDEEGDPEVERSYSRSSYRILLSSEGSRWASESTGEEISEAEFYSMLIYASPIRVLNLQQLSFELGGASQLVELNLQARLLVLTSVAEEPPRVPALLAELLEDEELQRSEYLKALLHEH